MEIVALVLLLLFFLIGVVIIRWALRVNAIVANQEKIIALLQPIDNNLRNWFDWEIKKHRASIPPDLKQELNRSVKDLKSGFASKP